MVLAKGLQTSSVHARESYVGPHLSLVGISSAFPLFTIQHDTWKAFELICAQILCVYGQAPQMQATHLMWLLVAQLSPSKPT